MPKKYNFRFSQLILPIALLSWLWFSPGNNTREAIASIVLSDTQLGNLRPEDLPRQANLPVLPLYSISQNVAIPGLHPPIPPATQGRFRVGIQIGHWRSSELPGELASLRGASGTNGGGVTEIEVGQNVSRAATALLKQENVDVDILPATVPQNYSADAFLSIHNDWSAKPTTTGFKLARSRYSLIPQTDDRLLDHLYQSYAAVTGFKRERGITAAMTGYYAFNNLKYRYTLNGATPAAIIELGFLTNTADRNYLATQPGMVAKGLVRGLMAFLNDKAVPEIPSQHLPTLRVMGAPGETVPVFDPSGQQVAFVTADQQFAYFQVQAGYYSIWLPVLNRFGRISTDQSKITTN
jgi:N-acetylmuramoyl-L-alanine amidase